VKKCEVFLCPNAADVYLCSECQQKVKDNHTIIVCKHCNNFYNILDEKSENKSKIIFIEKCPRCSRYERVRYWFTELFN